MARDNTTETIIVLAENYNGVDPIVKSLQELRGRGVLTLHLYGVFTNVEVELSHTGHDDTWIKPADSPYVPNQGLTFHGANYIRLTFTGQISAGASVDAFS